MYTESRPSAVAHSSSSESNSEFHTQFHSLTDLLFQLSRTHTHSQKKPQRYSDDCLLHTSECSATCLLLTFNRVHYGGSAPVQLLLCSPRRCTCLTDPYACLAYSHQTELFTSRWPHHTPVVFPDALTSFRSLLSLSPAPSHLSQGAERRPL